MSGMLSARFLLEERDTRPPATHQSLERARTPRDHFFGQQPFTIDCAAALQPFPHDVQLTRAPFRSYQQLLPLLHERTEHVHVATAGLHCVPPGTPELDPPELEPLEPLEPPELDEEDDEEDEDEMPAPVIVTAISASMPMSGVISPAIILSIRSSGQPGAEIGVKPNVKFAFVAGSARNPRYDRHTPVSLPSRIGGTQTARPVHVDPRHSRAQNAGWHLFGSSNPMSIGLSVCGSG
jgi:hypothetical protein